MEQNTDSKYMLRKTRVTIGKQNDQFVEILSGLPSEGSQIVLTGVDTL